MSCRIGIECIVDAVPDETTVAGVGTRIQFCVTDWSAWAPGLDSADQWMHWARNPFLPHGDSLPSLSHVAPMQRRRIDRLGRAAIQAADGCRRAEDSADPLVFASRHGDVVRSLALLEALNAGEPMSPTQFGLSVHNAIAAQYSILHGLRGNYTALAGGTASVETALVEAAGLLADGAASVTMVYCDATLPPPYTPFRDECEALYAFAWRMTDLGHGHGRRMSLAWEAGDDDAPENALLPKALAAHRYLLLGESVRRSHAGGLQWWWHQDA
ncbi:beta-ketoacyl synthase chain length factor [Xanthomonadaceae bacterium XH05]|nr:beta-ketoacyl synthase chain length factor [Xanthomonadaceae bacterium XH05]